MGFRLSLPLASPPTVDRARRQLGGRASTEPGSGEVLRFEDERGITRLGVVLFVHGDTLDLWLSGDVVRRVRRNDTQPAASTVPEPLDAVARDARAFAALREGQRVRYQHPDGPGEGELVEKCRFGGLVARTDRSVLAVGFRRLSVP